MIGFALSTALQVAAHTSGVPHAPVYGPPSPGVDLRQELRDIQWRKGEQLKLISQAYEPKTIALTFDDGPHPYKTSQLLRLLKDLDIKATFFVVGKMVDKSPNLVRAEIAQGHEVGNHTYDHVNLDTVGPAQLAFEYRACSDAIQRATGYRPRFCRPPGGRFNTEVLKAASDEGMWTVLWTDDPGDFARPDPKVLVERIDRQMKNGGILLLHDGIPQTIDILPEVVRQLRLRGYKFVTCSELLAQKVKSQGFATQKSPPNKSLATVLRRRPAK